MQYWVVLPLLIASIAGLVYFGLCGRKYSKTVSRLHDVIAQLVDQDSEVKETLLIGLYQRFGQCEIGDDETPLGFEKFVAGILENYYNTPTYVTKGSGDFGVDIEIKGDALYLAQVKCYDRRKPVNYEPIALLHSQMIKLGAEGGIVVTTSSFTRGAIQYAKGLNIELISGSQLIEMWADTMQFQKERALELVAT